MASCDNLNAVLRCVAEVAADESDRYARPISLGTARPEEHSFRIFNKFCIAEI